MLRTAGASAATAGGVPVSILSFPGGHTSVKSGRIAVPGVTPDGSGYGP